jgi:hypothetical protein
MIQRFTPVLMKSIGAFAAMVCFALMPSCPLFAIGIAMIQPLISSAQPTYATTPPRLNIAGANLGTTAPVVKINGVSAVVVSYTNSLVVVQIPASIYTVPGSYDLTLTRGSDQCAAGSTFDVAIGAIGPQGPAGPIDPAGAPGATSALGVTGTAVAKGVARATGSAVRLGLRGAVGPIAPIGPIGVTGAAGATGSAGSTGFRGAVGPIAPIGPIGVTGAAVAKGVAGAMGFAGSTGFRGAVGPIAPIGPIGVTGAAGANRVAGARILPVQLVLQAPPVQFAR